MNRRLFLGDICGGLLGGSLFGNRLFLFDKKINKTNYDYGIDESSNHPKSIRDYLDNPELNKKMMRKIIDKIPQTNPPTKNIFIDRIYNERVVPIGTKGIIGYYKIEFEDNIFSLPIIRYKSTIDMSHNSIITNRWDIFSVYLGRLVENVCKSISNDRRECIDFHNFYNKDTNCIITSYNYNTNLFFKKDKLILEHNIGTFIINKINNGKRFPGPSINAGISRPILVTNSIYDITLPIGVRTRG